MSKRSPLGIWCVLLALIAMTVTFSYAATAPRIKQQIDESKMVKLAGNTRPEANTLNDRGPVSDVMDIDHMLLLLQRSPQKEKQLEKLIDSLNDRKSPNFHKWLTPEEFGEKFGVAQQDIETVTNWLESHGFRINQVYANRMVIDISGTAGQMREAFGTEIHQLNVNGEQHIANISDPQIPVALAPVVKGFFSLNDFKPHPMYRVAPPDYTFAGCAATADHPTLPGTCYEITPQDTATIYNLNPLYSAGYSGQGQTIAVVEDTDTYNGTGDWTTYRNTFGLTASFPSGTYTTLHPGGCADPGTNADDGEAALDVEVATAVAPSAAIENIACPSGTVTFGGLIALQNLINAAGPYPGVVSVSYGVCEAFNGNGGNQAFFNTYQQAASQGISVFGASGDEGPSSCSADFSVGTEYDVASLGVSGWTDTPYNVAVGGTDFEDVYNAKYSGNALSTYWNPSNTSGYGSAISYIPEMPWNDSCANLMISEVARSSFTTYGSTGTCNVSPWDTTAGYLISGAGSGGASNCATGAGGTNQGEYGITGLECQGWPKPSWQSAYGVPKDGVRDIPDVSLFASNGLWGHYEVVCWSDPTQTSGGAASCSGAPSSWTGFGGTSVASPTMAGIQALVNQKTAEMWGNPNPIYYQIAQSEYGTQGGSFLGSGCNSTTGSGAGCVFNDVTEGDIDVACEDNGTTEEAHCYKPSGTRGVDSTDNVTAAVVLWGGSGYTSAPACAIAGPTNNQPYKAPAHAASGAGTTEWAGGTQAACTASVNASTTTAVWTVVMASTSGVGDQIILVNPTTGSTECGPYTLSGASTTAMASALGTAIGTACPVASESVSSATVTLTAKTAGAAGNFITEFGTATEFDNFYVYITNTTKGQGPNYVSGITITTAGTGYQPNTPITLTSGVGGTGAMAVANTSVGTASQSYQPAYGAAPGYDMATGLGSVNAYNLVNASPWYIQAQTITFTTPPPTSATYGSTFPVAATASSGLIPSFSASGGCSVVDNGNGTATYTMTSGVNSCSVTASQAGNGSYYPVTSTYSPATTAVKAVLTVSANNANMNYGDATFPAFSANITGYVNGDNSSVVSGSPAFNTNAQLSGPASTPGQYTLFVTQGTLAATNYTFTFVNAFLNIAMASPATNLGANPANIGTGDSTTLTATVTGSPNGVAPTGNVTFYLGETQLGVGCLGGCPDGAKRANHSRIVTEALLAKSRKNHKGQPEYPGVAAVATLSVPASALQMGANSITATYAGDTNYDTEPISATTVTVNAPGIYTPTPGGTLTGYSATFSWYGAAGATAYWIDIGSTPGGNTYYQSGSLPTSTETVTVNDLPVDGSTVYVTLYWLIGGNWVSNPYTYTAFGGSSTLGQITSPTPQSTLTGSTVTFDWSAGSAATAYWLDAGSSAGGNQYYQSGNLGNVLTTTVTTLPTDGSTVYVTLYSYVSGQWLSNAYTYTAYNLASQDGVITSPIPGSTLTSSSATFVWTAGAGATNYWLDVGSTPGGNQYEQSGALGNVTTLTVNGLPTDGSTIYVTLYSYVGGMWSGSAYTYTAFTASGGLGVMTSPTPGSTLSGNQVTFNWSAGSGATAYWVDVSDVGPGGNDLDQSGNLGNVLTYTIYNLPADGSTVYVTLYSLVGGQWLSNGYTYVSGP